jgi:hypothetical protein
MREFFDQMREDPATDWIKKVFIIIFGASTVLAVLLIGVLAVSFDMDDPFGTEETARSSAD